MGYSSLRSAVNDLERTKQLVRISQEVDPHLEMAEIQRRVYEAQGPAIYFEKVKGSPFPAVCNLFGTLDRGRFLFRDTLPGIRKVMQVKADPSLAARKPFAHLGVPFTALRALPVRSRFGAPILHGRTTLSQLPQLVSWPMDGGPFITLPQVFTEDPDKPGPMKANVGMYRIQIGGNDYVQDQELGLHYQIHRGIGVHHARALEKGQPLRVSIFVGGPPAHTFAAVMPLPEGLSEVLFAGMLGGRRFRWTRWNEHFLSSDADFCIVGTLAPFTKPEGPFGDHLGYYSLAHDFPVLKVEAVFHRKDAIWPFTAVGRPPQEDTTFGTLIHEITEPVVATEIPGLHAMHAVDAAGVHPLLLAIGSERYVPYGKRKPLELLTIANAVLGFGQASLAKYLFMVAREDNPSLDIHDMGAYLRHLLERADWRCDLHFQTKTTMDTLDYSGTGLNSGSKVVLAVAGEPIRALGTEKPSLQLPALCKDAKVAQPGVLVVGMTAFTTYQQASLEMDTLSKTLEGQDLKAFPLIVIVDDVDFASGTLNNWLWVTFTRSNPSHDIYGVGSFVEHKHWGCNGPLLIDARIKPHHAPPLVEDPATTRKVDQLAAKGGPLAGIL
jgi:4-hydroxy-3-polyprenylbenzoate decarboxylase